MIPHWFPLPLRLLILFRYIHNSSCLHLFQAHRCDFAQMLVIFPHEAITYDWVLASGLNVLPATMKHIVNCCTWNVSISSEIIYRYLKQFHNEKGLFDAFLSTDMAEACYNFPCAEQSFWTAVGAVCIAGSQTMCSCKRIMM